MTERKETYQDFPEDYRDVCKSIHYNVKSGHEQAMSVINSGDLREVLLYLAQFIDGKMPPNHNEKIIISISLENIMWLSGYGSGVLPLDFWDTTLGHFLMQAIWLLHDGEWLTAQEAETLTGKSQSAFNQWYKRHGIQPYVAPDGRLAFLRGEIEAQLSET